MGACNSVYYEDLTERENRLIEAIRTGDIKEAKKILALNVNVNHGNPLFVAVEKNRIELIILLLEYKANPNLIELNGIWLERLCLYTSMHAATRSYTLARLMQAGGNINVVNKEGETPLMTFIKNGYNDCALYAIANGAKTYLKDKKGKTALCYARHYGRAEIVEMLS
jgi:ankyrin repeat protein